MNHNPYAIPEDLRSGDDTPSKIQGDTPPSAGPLHPLSGVVAATFLGTPMGGAIVIAISLWRLGRRNAAVAVTGIMLLITLAFFALLMGLPDDVNVPGSAIAVPQLIIMYLLGKQLYGRELSHQIKAGGRIASTWKGAGIGLLSLVAMIPILLGIALISEGVGPSAIFANHGQLIEFENDEIYIAGDTTAEDADRLATALKEINFFGQDGTSVQIRREGSQTIVAFVVHDGVWQDESTVEAFRSVGVGLHEAGFDSPLSIELCNDNFEAQRTLTIE
jgi:hypothetical protein